MMSHPQDYIWGPGTLIKAINYTSHRKDFRQVVNEQQQQKELRQGPSGCPLTKTWSRTRAVEELGFLKSKGHTSMALFIREAMETPGVGL